MKVLRDEKTIIYVKNDEHANLHSLPFRFGFYFQNNKTLEIFDCKNWTKETKKDGEEYAQVIANFRDEKGEVHSGKFTLINNKAKYLKLVTVWDPEDRNTEYFLSDLIRSLCEKKILTSDDLVKLHPFYKTGEATTTEGLIKAITKIFPGKEVASKDIENEITRQIQEKTKVIKDEITEEVSKNFSAEIKHMVNEAVKDSFSNLTPDLMKAVSEISKNIIEKRQEKKPSVEASKQTTNFTQIRNKEARNNSSFSNNTNCNIGEKVQKIYGPPGTGKTTTLINLVKTYVHEGVNPSEIGFFAFTNFSTKVAQERIIEAFPNLDVSIDFSGFRTLHSLAYRSLPKAVEILNKEQAKEFDRDVRIEEVMMEEDDPSSIVYRVKHPVIDAAATARAKLISFEEHLKNLTRADTYFLNSWLGKPYNERENPIKESDFEKLFSYNRKYEKYKNALGVIDYTTILEMAVDEKNTIPQFKIVFIDEAQDLSKLQWKLAERLFEAAEIVYLAGDDDQAICESFGASPETFVTFLSANEKVLEQSYRVPRQNHSSLISDGTIHELDKKFVRKKKTWTPKVGADGWYGDIGRGDLVKLIKKYPKKDWLIMAARHQTISKLSDYLSGNNIQHFLSNRLFPDTQSQIRPSIKLATIWGAKGGEAEITAFLRDEEADERMLSDDPRLAYVAKTRSKAVHFNVKKRADCHLSEIEKEVSSLPDFERGNYRDSKLSSIENEGDVLPKKLTSTTGAPQDRQSIIEALKTINKPPLQKQKYSNNAAKIVDVKLTKRGRRECVEISLDDGSRRARMWDIPLVFDVCKKLIGYRVVTDVANPQKNSQFEWFNNIYLEEE